MTDRLKSCGAAMQRLRISRQHVCRGRRINNRAENSHQPFRRRERAMLRFRRLRTLQKFTAVHGAVHNHFNSQRHVTGRRSYKVNRMAAMAAWQLLLA